MTTRFDAIIIGTGQVGPFLAQRGLEFGEMFHRFGSEVAITEKGPRLIRR
jgi:pyruvate/2-oxoglutarate dehydrogenase complex dihydrolipoamide dehydrogenase (E3) component